MLGSPSRNADISPLSQVSCQHLSISLPPPLTYSPSTQDGSSPVERLSWGDVQTLKFGQAENSFRITKEQLPLLFSPGLWISQVSMKLSSKKLSDIINTLFVCALSSSKYFHNSELALSSWCSLEAGTVKIKQLELLISELGLQKPCSPTLLEVWKVAKLRNALMDSVCSAKHLISFLELYRHDSSL